MLVEKSQELIYHTFFAEFRGNTPEEVVKALYENSARVTGQTYSEWWGYQKKLWGGAFLFFPKETQPHACASLLNILVKSRALEPGPQAKSPRALIPGVNLG